MYIFTIVLCVPLKYIYIYSPGHTLGDLSISVIERSRKNNHPYKSSENITTLTDLTHSVMKWSDRINSQRIGEDIVIY